MQPDKLDADDLRDLIDAVHVQATSLLKLKRAAEVHLRHAPADERAAVQRELSDYEHALSQLSKREDVLFERLREAQQQRRHYGQIAPRTHLGEWPV